MPHHPNHPDGTNPSWPAVDYRFAHLYGDPSNPITIYALLDDWDDPWTDLTDSARAALFAIDPDLVQAALDEQFAAGADRWWDFFDSVRAQTTQALLNNLPPGGDRPH